MSDTFKPVPWFLFLWWCLKGSRLAKMDENGEYIARCNDCTPRQENRFRTEKQSKDWGRDHELTHRLMSDNLHTVRYAHKPKVNA